MTSQKSFELDQESGIPLYVQIKEELIKKIHNNEYEVNDQLPPETELIDFYGVSRTTIRRTIDTLVNEGYLKVKRGVGTFIRKPNMNLWDLAELRSFNEEVSRQGLVGKTKMINMEIVETDDHLKNIFGNAYQLYYRLDRLRYIEDEPSILVTTFIPKDLAPNINQFNFAEVSLFKILSNEYKFKIDHAVRTFRAINVSKEDAALLKIKTNCAIQLVDTVTYDDLGRVIDYSISRDRGDITKFKVVLKYND